MIGAGLGWLALAVRAGCFGSSREPPAAAVAMTTTRTSRTSAPAAAMRRSRRTRARFAARRSSRSTCRVSGTTPGEDSGRYGGALSEKIPLMGDGTTTAHLDPETGERFLPLRRQLGVSTFGMNQIVLQPGQRGRIHRHQRQEEVYLVLEGTLTLMVEEEQLELAEGELIRLAPALRRQLVNRGPGSLVLLALGGDGEHNGRDGEAFSSWSEDAGAPPQEVPLPADLDRSEIRG